MSIQDERRWFAGLLIRGPFREYLEALRYNGDVEQFYEKRGLFESMFYVRGKQTGQVQIASWTQEREG